MTVERIDSGSVTGQSSRYAPIGRQNSSAASREPSVAIVRGIAGVRLCGGVTMER